MLAGFSQQEILHEILIAPRSGIVPLADTTIIERPGFWQLVTPSLARGGMNEVACSELPDDADAFIDEILAPYRRLDIRFRWTLGPLTSPAGLTERLAQRGLERSEALGMARATGGAAPEDAGVIAVDEVDLANVDVFTRVMAEGWQADPAPLDQLHRRFLADPARRNAMFIARHEGAPAAVAGYAALDRSAYLIGAVTLPAFRGRGLYRALVDARLRHAAARGLALATSVARAQTSAPILARLGFQTVCAITSYMG